MPAQKKILAALLVLQAAVCPFVVGEILTDEDVANPAKSPRRVVHHFDFEERAEGNLEDLPRHWSALHSEGFPRFTRGSFDDAVGHASPPSFHIESMGRNVVFRYDGPEIRIQLQSEYRIDGFIRNKAFKAARVCMSAHFLNAERQPLLATSRRTPYIAQQREAEWTAFELHMPAAPAGAQFLGLSAWILQDATWNPDHTGRAISLVDVGAEVWLDDISVYRLPRVDISTRSPGNILTQHEAALWVTLTDSLDSQLTADLTVMSADGASVMRRQLSNMDDPTVTERIDLSGLGAGLFEARVEVVEQGRPIVSRSIRFLQQPPSTGGVDRKSRSFGLVLDPANRADLRTELALLAGHSARSLKVPVSPPASSSDSEAPGHRVVEQYYQELARNQFSLTGVLTLGVARSTAHPAPEPNDSSETVPTIDDGETDSAHFVSSVANVFRWWQIGTDGQSALEDLDKIKATAKRLVTLLERYNNATPRIALPLTMQDDVNALLPAVQQAALTVNNASDLWHLRERIKTLKENGVGEVSVFVPPLSTERFAREPRLAEWARRVLEARHAGADVVYIPQPWIVRRSEYASAVEPDEEYLLFKTISGLVGDAKPGPIVAVAEHVRCLAFREHPHSIVAMWDEAPSSEGRRVAIQLGPASRQVDLWGNATPLHRDEAGRSLVAISAMPVLIDRVDNNAIDFSSSVSLEPAFVESGTELVDHEIVIDCSTALPESGEGTLFPPPGIDVSPRSFSFSACAGEPVRIPVQVRYANNEPAGKKKFTAKVTLSRPGYQFEIPLTVDVRMSDLEVSGRAIMEGNQLLLRHTIQNQSQHAVSFRGIAGVPGRQREYQPISNLQPGKTQTLEYRFPDASALMGRKVNLALRESNDGPRKHNLEILVP
jgi:hypothetical protein